MASGFVLESSFPASIDGSRSVARRLQMMRRSDANRKDVQVSLWRRIYRTAAITLFVILLPPALMLTWMQTRGSWRLSATNTNDGVLVDVFWGRSTVPKYSTILPDRMIPRNITRATREELPSDVGMTTFYDTTIRPGRWTLVLDGVELDIMEARMIINGNAQLTPTN